MVLVVQSGWGVQKSLPKSQRRSLMTPTERSVKVTTNEPDVVTNSKSAMMSGISVPTVTNCEVDEVVAPRLTSRVTA